MYLCTAAVDKCEICSFYFSTFLQMPKNVKDAKLCLLTCPFEPPKPKTKHKLDIASRDAYEKLFEREQKYFSDMVRQCKDVGTNLVSVCVMLGTVFFPRVLVQYFNAIKTNTK